jgi:hypothetical protein
MIFLLSSPTFNLQNENLIRDRKLGTCGLIMGKDGELLVAIIGGIQKGMEVWNPWTKAVELLSDVIPPEQDGIIGLTGSKMVSPKRGQEIILYGGFHGSSYLDGIWKYYASNDTWERYFPLSLPILSFKSN